MAAAGNDGRNSEEVLAGKSRLHTTTSFHRRQRRGLTFLTDSCSAMCCNGGSLGIGNVTGKYNAAQSEPDAFALHYPTLPNAASSLLLRSVVSSKTSLSLEAPTPTSGRYRKQE
jgi:hypothetical protein